MSERKPDAKHPAGGVYAREIRTSLQNNAGAYGYSVMITCSFGMLNAVYNSPNALQVFVFAMGAVASFLVIELLATNGFRRSLGQDEDSPSAALGSSLGVLSISSALGVALGIALLLPATLAWFATPLVASTTYLMVTPVEMLIARRLEHARDLS